MHTTTAFITSLALCSIAAAQNVGSGAGTAESREAIQNTGDTQPPADAPAAGPGTDTRFKLAGGFVQQFNTTVNSGGNYAASRAYAAFSSKARLTENMNLDMGIGYEFDHYEFHGPFTGVRTARKHVGWYLGDAPGAIDFLRNVFYPIETPEAQLAALERWFDHDSPGPVSDSVCEMKGLPQ